MAKHVCTIILGLGLMIPTSGVIAQSESGEESPRGSETVLPMGRLVLTSDRDGDLDIWRYEAETEEALPVTSGSGLDRTPALSPDGTRVAFSTDRFHGAVGFSARGSTLAAFDIYTVAIDGSDPVRAISNRRFNAGPAWSPDGTMIAYGGEVISPEATLIQVHVVPADGSAEPVALTDDPVQAGGPAWSPFGSRIAYTSLRHGQNEDGTWNREIYVMAANGTDHVRLTDDPAEDGGPAWSPDGSRIAFHSDRAGNDDIYVMDADGTNVLQLTDDPEDDDFPSWSPDGTMIAFVSQRDGDREVYLMRADGSGQARLTANAEDFPEHRGADDFPSWGVGP